MIFSYVVARQFYSPFVLLLIENLRLAAQLLGFDNFIPPFATATGQDIIKGVNYGSGGAGIRDDTGRQLVFLSHFYINFLNFFLVHPKIIVIYFIWQIHSCLISPFSPTKHFGLLLRLQVGFFMCLTILPKYLIQCEYLSSYFGRLPFILIFFFLESIVYLGENDNLNDIWFAHLY